MFCNVLHFSLIFLSIKLIFSYPMALELLNSADFGYQIFNSSDLLVYQQYDLVEDKSSKRNKRWLEEFYSYFYDSSEEDSSSEEEVDDDDASGYKLSDKLSDNNSNNKTAYGLCHDCIVTYNQVHQVQHINRLIHSDNLNSSSTTPINTYEIKATLTTPKPRKTNNPQGKTIESNEITTVDLTATPTTMQPKTLVTAEITTVSDTQTPIEAVTKVQMTTKVSETPKQDATNAVTVAPTTIVTLVTTEATTAVTEPNA